MEGGPPLKQLRRKVALRKPNYSQDRMQRERDKAAKAQAKEQKKLEQKEAKLATTSVPLEGDPERRD